MALVGSECGTATALVVVVVGDDGEEIAAVGDDGVEEAGFGAAVAVVDYAGVDEGAEEGGAVVRVEGLVGGD